MNHPVHTFLLTIVLAISLSACSTAPHTPSARPQTSPIDTHSPVASRLSAHYQDWQGTPYRLGGQSKRGIDCSGFVQITYREVFGKQVPRTTELLSKSGQIISLKQARLGDLLVFRTGFKQQHVGIYIGRGKFIHASTSKGVMTSRLDNSYWSESYRQTRRLVDI